jgi:hypothetical protein
MKKRPRAIPTDAATIRRISVAASADPRSVRKEMEEPGSVRGLPGHRIRAALAKEADQASAQGDVP